MGSSQVRVIKVTYVELLQTIQAGSVVHFKEYSLDRHERKKLTLEIPHSVVERVVKPLEKLNKEELETYYSGEFSDVDYLQLSSINGLRLVLNLGVDQYGKVLYKTLIISQDFIDSGLQEIQVIQESTQDEPIYANVMKYERNFT